MRKLIRRLGSAAEVENTRVKLRELEAQYAAAAERLGVDAEVRRLTLISLRRMINQLKEEIVVYAAKRIECGGN